MKTRAESRIKKKDTKKSLVKKQRGTSVGSIATNLHEGSRSEYLAQYVFSSSAPPFLFHIKRIQDSISIARCSNVMGRERGHARTTQYK